MRRKIIFWELHTSKRSLIRIELKGRAGREYASLVVKGRFGLKRSFKLDEEETKELVEMFKHFGKVLAETGNAERDKEVSDEAKGNGAK